MKRVLVFGASGQIGDALLPMLRQAHCDVVAVSRSARSQADGLEWVIGTLDESWRPPAGSWDAVFCLGPLDLFARWQTRVGPLAPRIVAFGSTSVQTKAASGDPSERDVSERLRAAEESLFAGGARHGVGVSVLRPTLIYGRGRDRTLCRIAALARRHRLFVLPRHAKGLRQPVHADDLAAAALACAHAPGAEGRAYALPGGETLRYDDMVRRVLAVLPERPRLLRLPAPLFGAAIAGARRMGWIDGLGSSMLARLDVDLVFDDADARRDFGYAPRAFAPEAAMFPV